MECHMYVSWNNLFIGVIYKVPINMTCSSNRKFCLRVKNSFIHEFILIEWHMLAPFLNAGGTAMSKEPQIHGAYTLEGK